MAHAFYPVAARRLFYRDSNVGLGFPIEECYFSVDQGDTKHEWSIADTLARLAEFSPWAKHRIMADCAAQIKYGAAREAIQ